MTSKNQVKMIRSILIWKPSNILPIQIQHLQQTVSLSLSLSLHKKIKKKIKKNIYSSDN